MAEETINIRKVDIGIGSHSLITDYVNWFKSLIIDSAPKGKNVICANIMYTIPRIGGTFHLAPLIPPGNFPIIGVSSPFFNKLNDLNIQFPNQADLEQLLKFGNNCPIAINSARDLLHYYNNGKKLPLLPIKGQLSNPIIEMDILHGLITAFSNPDSYKNIVIDFNSEGVLSTAIQCLLGFLPQFEKTKAATMKQDGNPNEKTGEVIEGIRWVSKDIKMNLWEKNAKNNKPRDRAFWLLSYIESLQWVDDSEFGAVDSLYDFLISNKLANKKSEEDSSTKTHLDDLWFFLNQISFYFNVSTLNKSDKEKLSKNLKSRLQAEVSRIASLAANVSMWHLQRAELKGSRQNSTMAALAQAILNISSPQALTYFDSNTKNNLSLLRKTIDEYDHYNNGDKAPGEIFLRLCNPWGVYEKGIISTEKDIYPILIQMPNMGSIKMAFNNNKDIQAIDSENITLELRQYLHDCFLRNQPNEIENIFSGIKADEEWYKKAFDEYYIAFDLHRHKDNQNPEFELREGKEEYFYKNLLSQEFDYPNDNIKLLDVGIGYGRLTQKLKNTNLISMSNYHGLEYSKVMINKCKGKYPDIIVHEGDMRDELCHFSNQNIKFDIGVFAFTTFGCYRDIKDLQTLTAIGDIINPYGLVIIEQHNPMRKIDKPIIDYKNVQVGERTCRLLKTSRTIHNEKSEDYADYTGEYLYYQTNDYGAEMVKHDLYCIRLYADSWIKQTFETMNFHTDFYADFDLEKGYSDYMSNAIVMICVAKKLPCSSDKYKTALKNIGHIWDWIGSNIKDYDFEKKLVNKIKKILKDIEENGSDKYLSSFVRVEPKIDDLEKICNIYVNHKFNRNESKEAIANILKQWFGKMN